jgi:hypothetical protein
MTEVTAEEIGALQSALIPCPFKKGEIIFLEGARYEITNAYESFGTIQPAKVFEEKNNNKVYTKPKDCGQRKRSTVKRPRKRTKAGYLMELHPTKGWKIIKGKK